MPIIQVKKLAWRADFDALPIQEDNDLPFKSQKPGVMHASGSIRLIHQPAGQEVLYQRLKR